MRRAVKAIAVACASEQRAYKSMRNASLSLGKLAKITNDINAKQAELARLQEGALSSSWPTPGFARSLRSAAVLGGAALSLPVAAVPAAVGAAVDTGIAAARIPVATIAGTFDGAVAGCAAGATAASGMLKVPAAIAGIGVGGVALGALEAVLQALAVPFASLRRGSFARKMNATFNKLQAGREHVERKGMSTMEIAQATQQRLAEFQYQVFIKHAERRSTARGD